MLLSLEINRIQQAAKNYGCSLLTHAHGATSAKKRKPDYKAGSGVSETIMLLNLLQKSHSASRGYKSSHVEQTSNKDPSKQLRKYGLKSLKAPRRVLCCRGYQAVVLSLLCEALRHATLEQHVVPHQTKHPTWLSIACSVCWAVTQPFRCGIPQGLTKQWLLTPSVGMCSEMAGCVWKEHLQPLLWLSHMVLAMVLADGEAESEALQDHEI